MGSNLIISVSAIIIALASFIVTIWQGIISRKHYRLSVKPIPDILLSNFEDRITVNLENKGTGPFIMKSFRAYVGNESKTNVIDWMPDLPDGCLWSNWLKDFEGAAFKASESKALVEYSLDTEDALEVQARDIIRKALSDVSIEFDYTDIYGTKMCFPLHLLSSTFGKYK